MSTTRPDPKDFLTVEEAARVLRLGRTAAYALARTWRETDGQDGLPVVAFGRSLRVPRAALEAISGAPISPPAAPDVSTVVSVDAPAVVTAPGRAPRRTRHRRTRHVSPGQAVLPLD